MTFYNYPNMLVSFYFHSAHAILLEGLYHTYLAIHRLLLLFHDTIITK